MASSIHPLNPAASGTGLTGFEPSASQAPSADQAASKETFLKLLVAQIKNQNPLSPNDGIEFVSQLAQFTELEQVLTMRQDLGAIREFVEAAGNAGGSGASAPASAGR